MRNLQGSMVVLLASSMLCQCLSAFAAGFQSPSSHKQAIIATDHARALHLLDRMTFGPRPGDVETAERMGIHRWLDLQLHPKKIEDGTLDKRLENYRASFMTPQQLMLRFPSGNLVRQALDGRINIPTAEPDRAVWQNQIAIMQQRRLAKQAKAEQPSMQPASNTMAAPEMTLPPIDNPGASSNLDARLLDLPAQQRYEQILQMQAGQFAQFARSVPLKERPELIASMTPAQRETVIALVNPRLVVVNEAEAARLQRDIYSQRQLERVMTEFWLNHFNIYTRKNEVEPYYLPQFENLVIAPHALGKFEDLLDAVAQSPAMLIYLDNIQSIGPDSVAALRREYPGVPRFQLAQLSNVDAKAMRSPVPPQLHNKPNSGINENYGRELMELHTVGVNGGYTQQDVIQAARVLTGWTVAQPRQGGGFRFDPNRHEPGDKIVMGHRIKSGGEKEGLELLHILATSPATAHFISQELAVRFVSDHPSQVLVNRMAKSFLSTHGDIAKVLKTMIDSPEFWSTSDTGNKIKTPLDYVISAARATDADVTQPYRLVSELRVMGMPLTGTEQPNGYAMTSEAWTSSSELIDRMNFALALASNRIPGVTVPLDQLFGPDSAGLSPEQQESRLEQVILHGPAPAKMHAAVLETLNETPQQHQAAASIVLAGDRGGCPFSTGMSGPDTQPTDRQQSIMAGLLLGSPEFQRR